MVPVKHQGHMSVRFNKSKHLDNPDLVSMSNMPTDGQKSGVVAEIQF